VNVPGKRARSGARAVNRFFQQTPGARMSKFAVLSDSIRFVSRENQHLDYWEGE
jgi:hypothetical protein